MVLVIESFTKYDFLVYDKSVQYLMQACRCGKRKENYAETWQCGRVLWKTSPLEGEQFRKALL